MWGLFFSVQRGPGRVPGGKTQGNVGAPYDKVSLDLLTLRLAHTKLPAICWSVLTQALVPSRFLLLSGVVFDDEKGEGWSQVSVKIPETCEAIKEEGRGLEGPGQRKGRSWWEGQLLGREGQRRTGASCIRQTFAGWLSSFPSYRKHK